MSREEIDKICNRYGIHNITINNGLVDVNGSVNLTDEDLDEMPLYFGEVIGNFECNYNQLTSLEGCPHTVGGNFQCMQNKLKSLEGCPTKVGGSFTCLGNRITSLEHCPKEVGVDFNCNYNKIYSLDGYDTKVGDWFWIDYNPFGSISHGNQQDFIDAFKIYKIIKDKEVNLKRLKYVMQLFNKEIKLENIKKHYTIV